MDKKPPFSYSQNSPKAQRFLDRLGKMLLEDDEGEATDGVETGNA